MNWKVFVISAVLIAAGVGGVSFIVLKPRSVTQELVQELPAKAILEHIKSLNAPLTLVNFWASWCEPCKIEFPSLLTLRERYKDRGLQVIFISIDDAADLVAAETFLKEQHVDFPTFYKGNQTAKFINEIFPKWRGAVPTTVLIGADQQIKEAWEGDTTLEEFEERVTRHLEAKGS